MSDPADVVFDSTTQLKLPDVTLDLVYRAENRTAVARVTRQCIFTEEEFSSQRFALHRSSSSDLLRQYSQLADRIKATLRLPLQTHDAPVIDLPVEGEQSGRTS